MKPINLRVLVDINNKEDSELYNTYKSIVGVELQSHEINSLSSLINFMNNDLDVLSHYFVGYKIPQIGKEFDLLRMGKNSIINIELKSQSDLETMKEQLKKNKYYLEALGLPMYLFSYDESKEKLFILKDDNTFEEVSNEQLKQCILEQELVPCDNLDMLFNPTDFLVSPFNNSKKFIEGKYFLTNQQTQIKNEILKEIEQYDCIEIIKGNPGTGKTLLVYDIAKYLIDNGKKLGLIHCGILNNGHTYLSDIGWEIYEIKNYKSALREENNVIVIDEMQRIRPSQLKEIVEFSKINNIKILLSFDPKQYINDSEKMNVSNVFKYLNESETTYKEYKLTGKIRTNKEISSFIINLFDLTSFPRNQVNYNNVSLDYFENVESVKDYLTTLTEEGWTHINYSASRYHKANFEKYQKSYNLSAHKVIGQEFDQVVVVIDSNFYYSEEYDLMSKIPSGGNPNYLMNKMLYQMITRTRKKLKIVVFENESILKIIMNILNGTPRINVNNTQEV